MNWYKKSQQESFNFAKDLPETRKPMPEDSPEFQNLLNKAPMDLDDIVEGSVGYDQLAKNLTTYRINWERVDFPQADPLITIRDGKSVYIIDDFDNPTLKYADRWIWDVYDHELEQYIPSQDFNASFWEDVSNGSVVYHATTDEWKDHILKDGLLMKDETRGISNRSTGSAVFTSDNPYDIESYGDVIFEVNLGQMKADGFMPYVSKEEPLEEFGRREQLAHMIGLEDFHQDSLGSEGIYDTTVIFFDNIPAKYLKIM